eukprot:354318-Chlamydomonas_euryale.AAC.16
MDEICHAQGEMCILVGQLNRSQVRVYALPAVFTDFTNGYISVNGCSLTIGEVSEQSFTVYLIPETLRVTVFGAISVGNTVNIEIETQTQAIVDTTERVVAAYLARTAGANP